MSIYKFSNAQRYAIFLVHGMRCYLCRKPIDLTSMVVDHVLPEYLLSNPSQIQSAKIALGLPDSFAINSLNSFDNWLSAAHVHTSLLYVEKNAGVLEPGMAMTVIDAALQLVAAAFASTRIIIAAPRQSLVDYYRDEFGYKLAKKRERKTTAMFKDVEVQ